MALGQSTPRLGSSFTASAVTLLLIACCAGPVVAAPSTDIGCDDVADASLEVSAQEFKAHVVTHDIESQSSDQSESDSESALLSPASYLSPEAAATVREVFEEVSPLAEATPARDDDADEGEDTPEMKSRVPGVSNSELARYRQQMYRVDI